MPPIYDPTEDEIRKLLVQALRDGTNPPDGVVSPFEQAWRSRIAAALRGDELPAEGSELPNRFDPQPQRMMNQEAARNFYDRVGMPAHSATESAIDMAKSGGVGLGKAAIDILGMPGDIGELGSAATDYFGRKLGASPERVEQFKQFMRYSPHLGPFLALFGLPSSKDITGGVKQFTGEFYQPETTPGAVTERVAEFAAGLAMPGGPVRRVVGGVAAPFVGSELAGRIPGIELTSLEGPARSAGALAGVVAGAARIPGRAASSGASSPASGPTVKPIPHGSSSHQVFDNNNGLYDPPPKPHRPFEADYPRTPRADASGRLLEDIEGRKLVAKYIVGPRTLNGPDETLTPAQLGKVTEALTGSQPRRVGQEELPQNVIGRYFSPTKEHPFREMVILRSVDPVTRRRAVAHESGHMFHAIAGGRAPFRGTDDIIDELFIIYNDLNNPILNAVRATGKEPDLASSPVFRNFGPKARGYRDEKVAEELLAEGFRAYFADPNYMKTVAPKTAAAIREFVNSHPELSKIIQFNTLAGGTVSAAALAEALRNYQQEEAGGG
jgi:hypothetical protein